MIIFVIVFIIVSIIIFMIKNKILIRFDTFFRKGFEKFDDKYGVYCFCGKQGDGKTYSLIDTLELTRGNRKIITNVKSYWQNRKEYVIYETDFTKITQFLQEVEDCTQYIIFYDELFTLIEKGKLSKDTLSFISQMRKRGLYLYTTVQEWLELNITFRRYVRYQIECNMLNLPIFKCAISINRINDAYRMKWDNLQNEYIAPIIQTTIKKCSKEIADSYDTFEVIKTEGKLTTK